MREPAKAEAVSEPRGRRRPGVNIFDPTRPTWQLMLVFLIPLILSNILQNGSGTANSIFLGRMIGVHALAAVSSIFPIMFFLISFLIGLSTGSSVLIGQAFGAGDAQRMKAIAGTTLSMSLVLGLIVAIVGVVFDREVLQLVGTPPDVLDDAVAYARVVFIALLVFFPYLIYTTFLRGTGDSQTPFYFLILSTVLSIALTPALIVGWAGLPRLGIVSAAVAFFASNAIAVGALLAYLNVTRHPLRFDAAMARGLRIQWPLLVAVVRIGIPTGLQLVTVSLAEIAVLSFVNRFGSNATAAYGAVNQVVSYVQFPAISIGIASSIFGAQSIGAQRFDKLNGVIHAGIGLTYAIGATLIGICYLFSWNILGWFITSPGTLGIAHRLLMITLWSYVLFGNSSVLSGIMRSSGTVLWPTVIGIFSIWGVEVPVAYFLSQRIGLEGIWYGYPAAFLVGLTLQTLYYKLVWKKKTHQLLV